MSSQAALFEPERTYGVGEVAARITRAVASAFPAELWVKGEVTGLKRPNASGHVYFDLCERNSRRGPTSSVAVAVFRADRQRILRDLAEHPDFRLADGLEVRLRGRVQYAYGRISLVVTAVDPAHTLGQLAVGRERVLRALAADGLLEANRRLPIPLFPLHVGLVTSAGSAAYQDVVHELEASGFGFGVSMADASVQGVAAVPSLLAALTAVAAVGPDVVLLVRGGGARTDLASFDDERLARKIAGLAVPVLTGVGHEIDTTVADAVAAASYKTPTAAAAGVAELVRVAMGRAEGAWAGVARLGPAALAGAEERVAERAQRVAGRARVAVARADAVLADADRRLAPERLLRSLDRRVLALDDAVARLGRASADTLRRAGATVDLLDARANAADPARALARGWSLTRTLDGRLVRRAADVAPGDTLVTTLAEGTVRSTAVGTPPEPNE